MKAFQSHATQIQTAHAGKNVRENVDSSVHDIPLGFNIIVLGLRNEEKCALNCFNVWDIPLEGMEKGKVLSAIFHFFTNKK